MNILVPLGVAVAAFLAAYRTYPPFIARVFQEDDARPTPSYRLTDGVDFVRTRLHVAFAHHYATIAGAGPIVGPTLALAFGWQPVWLWIVVGGIFFGAVHDMATLFTSVRESGRTIGDIARRTLGPAGYLLNLLILIFVLSIINAIFLNLSITALTSVYRSLRCASRRTSSCWQQSWRTAWSRRGSAASPPPRCSSSRRSRPCSAG